MEKNNQADRVSDHGVDTDSNARHIRSEQLFGESNLVVIVHGAERYRLHRTRSGKLILTK